MSVALAPPAATRAAGSAPRLSRWQVSRSVAAGYVLFAATYVPINHWSIGRRAHVLYLPGEERLPFVPEFEYLYALTYVLPWLLVLAVRDEAQRRRCGVAFLLILGVACASYVCFPVYLERPALVPDSLATWLLALEYRDPSYNHFPSLHVAFTWFTWLACRRALRRAHWLFGLSIAISVSTLFVKQHYVADVASGAALAVWAWRQAGRPRRAAAPH